MAFLHEQEFYAIPPRVRAAMMFLEHVKELTLADKYDEASTRELSPQERAVERSALESLRLYFSGEQEFAAPPVGASPRHRGEDPGTAPVPVDA